MKVQLFCLLFCKNIILVKTVVIKKIYFVTPFAHDHNTWVRNKSTTFVFIEHWAKTFSMNFQERGRVFCWNIAAPAKWKNWIYRIEQIAQWRRNSFRNLFDDMIILFDVWLVWPWLDFGTLIRLGPLWLRWESNLPSLTMSILWEKKLG